MDRSIDKHLSKARAFEAGTESDPSFSQLDPFKELDPIVQQSFAPAPVAIPPTSNDNFILPPSRLIKTNPSLQRPPLSSARSFSEAIRARASARVQFSRSSIIKPRRPT